ncbi:hypothetical protein V6N13_098805 [Hibiscus sabdariffa]
MVDHLEVPTRSEHTVKELGRNEPEVPVGSGPCDIWHGIMCFGGIIKTNNVVNRRWWVSIFIFTSMDTIVVWISKSVEEDVEDGVLANDEELSEGKKRLATKDQKLSKANRRITSMAKEIDELRWHFVEACGRRVVGLEGYGPPLLLGVGKWSEEVGDDPLNPIEDIPRENADEAFRGESYSGFTFLAFATSSDASPSLYQREISVLPFNMRLPARCDVKLSSSGTSHACFLRVFVGLLVRVDSLPLPLSLLPISLRAHP